MSDSIDTEIKGEPDELRQLAADMRLMVAPAIEGAADTLLDARRGAEDTWNSPAGDSFFTTVHDAISSVDVLAIFLREAASGLDTLAGELESAQREMTNVRIAAAGAGLDINGLVIEHPGPPAPAPGPLAAEAGSSAVAEHREQTNAYDRQTKRIDAFTEAASHATEIRTKETNAASAWGDLVGDKQNRKIGFTAVGFGLSWVENEAKLRGERHRVRADGLLEAVKDNQALRVTRKAVDERLRLSRANRAILDDARRAQADWRASNHLRQTVGRANGVLAVGGIAYDIAVLDRPWHEATISGGASFGASVAAGALLGTAIPVPIFGTAIGAAFGAAVGIFASGAVDSLFEEDGEGWKGAAGAGWDAVADTGAVALNAVTSTWKSLF